MQEQVKESNLAQALSSAQNTTSCPVIKAINEEETGVQLEKASPFDFDEEFENEVPSMKEYKKLKRTMALMTQFYTNGSNMKGNNYKATEAEIAKLLVDKQMVEEQLAALNAMKDFSNHLKHKELLSMYEEELKRLTEKQDELTATAQKEKGLMEWSWEIVKICEWLEKSLDNYCNAHLDLPEHIKKALQPVPVLSAAQISDYSKGLDEIMHNLNESRDFFTAAVDGRLDQYYVLEEEMLEAQLKMLKVYPQENPRREMVEEQINEDLEHAKAQIKSGTEDATKKRRQAMLNMHLDFLRVLLFFRNKVKLLDDGVKREDRDYDSSFTTTFAF